MVFRILRKLRSFRPANIQRRSVPPTETIDNELQALENRELQRSPSECTSDSEIVVVVDKAFPLLGLDRDVLVCVLEEVLLRGYLKRLSTTCKLLHAEAKPLLFRRCQVVIDSPISAGNFLPLSLWRYVKYLTVVEQGPERLMNVDNDLHSPEPTLCGRFDSDFLTSALRDMPLLRRLAISSPDAEFYPHGLPWSSLRAILASPQIREFVLQFTIPCLMSIEVDDLDVEVAPLTFFNYSLSYLRDDPRTFTTERHALTILLSKLNHTLQKLILPVECAPPETLQKLHWSKLRDVTLYGEAPPSIIPYVVVLGSMPELRSLALLLDIRPGFTAPIIWPLRSGLDRAFPWPNLRSLELSHPHPDDQIYRYLPPTLRQLQICSPPYHYEHILDTNGAIRERELESPLLTASQMLHLLGQCRIPELSELAIEFLADGSEFDFWRLLPRAFPHLTVLTANVYRGKCEDVDVPVRRIAQALAPLARLHTLRTYLGFEPSYTPPLIRIPLFPTPTRKATRASKPKDIRTQARDSAAQEFVNAIGESLREVFILNPLIPNHYWVHYRVKSKDCGAVRKRGALEYTLEYPNGLLVVGPEEWTPAVEPDYP